MGWWCSGFGHQDQVPERYPNMSPLSDPTPRPTPRIGARRRADIPADVLERLHRGEESTRTLVEWLAIDQRRLIATRAEFWGGVTPALAVAAAGAVDLGIMDRIRAVARALAEKTDAKGRIFARIATDPADTVRCWAAFAAGMAEPEDGDLPRRLARIRPFAADLHMGVRECAWMALRPHLARDLSRAWKLLPAWAEDPDANLRRCAIEATRPRGVWCAHIESLKADPTPGLPLLARVRADPSKYVRDSCANWLNDATRTHPEWVRATCARWLAADAGNATAYTCRRAMRRL